MLHEVLPAQRPEDDDVVHPVEELGPEVIAQLVAHPLLHLRPTTPSVRAARRASTM